MSENGLLSSPNPMRLTRDPHHGVILGVCAGIARYFGVRRGLVRVIAILGFVFIPMFTILGYLALGYFLPRRPATPELSTQDEVFWRSVNTKPQETTGGLRHRFRELDRRLAALERCVTSEDYDLRRRFKDMERSREA